MGKICFLIKIKLGKNLRKLCDAVNNIFYIEKIIIAIFNL